MAFTFSELVEPLAGLTSVGDITLQDADALIWGTDLKLFRDGPWELALRDGNNDNFFYIYNQFTDSSNYARLALYAGSTNNFFIETQAAGTEAGSMNLDIRSGSTIDLIPQFVSAPTVFIQLVGSPNGDMRFNPDNNWNIGRNVTQFRPQDGYFTRTLYAGLAQTSPVDGLVLDSPNLAAPSFRDSNSILLTGKAHDGVVHDADWRQFVTMQNNDGTSSLWTLQSRIDAGGYVTRLIVDDLGNLLLNNGSGPSLLNETPSGTNPTLIPRRSEPENGIGSLSISTLNIITNSISRIQISEVRIETSLPMQGTQADAYAVLDETATQTNPTICPANSDFTTGLGGFDSGPGGQTLNMIVQGNNIFESDTTQGAFFLQSLSNNGQIHANGAADNVQLLVDAHSTQNADLVRWRNNSNANLMVFTVDGDQTISGSSGVANFAEGGIGKVARTTSREAHTLSLSTSSVTTTLAIPAGAILIGVSFNVDSPVVDDDGDNTWSALFSGGASTVLATAEAAASNTKVNTMFVPVLTTATTEVTFTPNGTNFTSGIIEVVVYYEELTDMDDV